MPSGHGSNRRTAMSLPPPVAHSCNTVASNRKRRVAAEQIARNGSVIVGCSEVGAWSRK